MCPSGTTSPIVLWTALLLLPSALAQHSVSNGSTRTTPQWQHEGVEAAATLSLELRSWYLPVGVDPDSQCGKDVHSMILALLLGRLWPLQMTDSWGKLNDGMLFGNLYLYGAFDECLNAQSPDHTFHGQYCTVFLHMENETTRNSATTRRPPAGLFYLRPLDAESKLSYATCMPHSCTAQDLQESLDEELAEDAVSATVGQCQVWGSHAALSAGDIAFTVLVSVLALVLLAAAGLEYYIKKTGNTTLAAGPGRFLLPFSFYSNLLALFHHQNQPAPSTISCLHGIRVLSMMWVVFAHQQSLTFFFQANNVGMWKKMNGLLYQILYNGYLAIDSFFFLSGFLVAYVTLNRLKKGQKFNLLLFYLHRLLRLMPSVALITFLYSTIVHTFVAGPAAYMWDHVQRTCQKTWWRDVLLINNFVHDHVSDDLGGDCVDHVWYLAVDTQLYLVAPLILLPLHHRPSLGKTWLFLLTVASIVIPSAITYANDLPPISLMYDSSGWDFVDKVYYMPWCRAGPWLVGIWLAYAMVQQGHKKVHMTPTVVAAGWTVAMVTCNLVVFGMWSYTTFPERMDYDVVTQVVYSGLHRPVWGAVLAWIVFACHYGYGGVVGEFLAHPLWQPISRLTFAIYLLSYPLQFAMTCNARTPYYFTHLNKVLETAGALVITGGMAVLLYLAIEVPVTHVEKLLLGKTVEQTRRPEDPRAADSHTNKAFVPDTHDDLPPATTHQHTENHLSFTANHHDTENHLSFTATHHDTENHLPVNNISNHNDTKF